MSKNILIVGGSTLALVAWVAVAQSSSGSDNSTGSSTSGGYDAATARPAARAAAATRPRANAADATFAPKRLDGPVEPRTAPPHSTSKPPSSTIGPSA